MDTTPCIMARKEPHMKMAQAAADEIERLRDALTELVACDSLLRLYVADGTLPQNYQQRCEAAWSKARDALRHNARAGH
jgi:hypothetical protein